MFIVPPNKKCKYCGQYGEKFSPDEVYARMYSYIKMMVNIYLCMCGTFVECKFCGKKISSGYDNTRFTIIDCIIEHLEHSAHNIQIRNNYSFQNALFSRLVPLDIISVRNMVNNIPQIMFLAKYSHNNINAEYIGSMVCMELSERAESVSDIQRNLLNGDYCCILCGCYFDVFPSAEVFKEHFQQCCARMIDYALFFAAQKRSLGFSCYARYARHRRTPSLRVLFSYHILQSVPAAKPQGIKDPRGKRARSAAKNESCIRNIIQCFTRDILNVDAIHPHVM